LDEQADRRRTRLVDRKFQFGLASRLLLVMTGFFLAGILLVFLPSAWVVATRNDLKSLEPAAAEFLVLHRRVWPAAILSFAGVFAYCLLFSHRVAGPVYRINAVLRGLLRGNPPAEVRFRKGDYFQETAVLLTEVCRAFTGPPAAGSPEPEGRGEPGGKP
jgi:hypothetical protein